VSVQDATVKRILTEENDEREMMNDERSERLPLFILLISRSSFRLEAKLYAKLRLARVAEA
jgi:hypothetical protein